VSGVPAAVARFDSILDEPRLKSFCRGTHRTLAPTETLSRVKLHAAKMGITRLGNITGLDRIGIPVAVAVRPNSRSVSVSQGKGLDLPQAMASALMEACEGFHAEEIGPCLEVGYRALAAAGEAVVDPATLCAGARRFDPRRPIFWACGYDLLQRQACWLPAEIVHTDFTADEPDGYFLAGSNGLAAGNDLVEALNAALFELVERDAVALWAATPPDQRAPLDLASVDDADCLMLLGKYAAAGIAVRVWDATSDIGIATFICEIRDLAASDETRRNSIDGWGCHVDRGIALARALTEAAQKRLTYIAGIRDDLPAAQYAREPGEEVADALLGALARAAKPSAFRDAPTFAAENLGDDLRFTLERLVACGIVRAVAVDLTRPEFGIPVVRLVVPGLEGHVRHPCYRPGARALAAAAARR
jgi:YcaO-like protein with predicted kinase domain